MNNISLDVSTFSDQLGLYDFFNVIVSGTAFLLGLCLIDLRIFNFFWINISIPKGIFIILLIYILGFSLQEIGSIFDRHLTKVQINAYQTFLKDLPPDGKRTRVGNRYNNIIKNQLLLNHYRKLADQIIAASYTGICNYTYDDNSINMFVYSIIQYYISCVGKDKKVEKMRALYALSRSLMACSGILSFANLLATVFIKYTSIIKPLFSNSLFNIWFIYAIFAVIFHSRMFHNMRHMMLILLGNYDAFLRSPQAYSVYCDIEKRAKS